MRLRTGFALSLLLAAGVSPALAKVRPGIDVGWTRTTLSHEHDDRFPFNNWDRHWRGWGTAGVSLELAGEGRVGLLTGLRYLRQGIFAEYRDGTTSADIRFSQHYLSMPVLLSLRPFPSRRLTIGAGPEVALLLAADVETRYTLPFTSSTNENIKRKLDPMNLSLDAQAEIEFPWSTRAGVVTLRYSHGVLGVAKKDEWASDWSTRDLEFLFGVRW